MSEPTLWVSTTDDPYDSLKVETITNGLVRPASRADVLAALPDKWWYHDGVYDNPRCSPDEPCHVAGVPHTGCHWAVKPEADTHE